MLVGTIVVLIEVIGIAHDAVGVAHADDHRPRLEAFTSSAPSWARDCSVDLVAQDQGAFSVAVNCRGSEELVLERRAKRPGPKSGTVTSFDGSTRVLAWKTTKYATDVYACTSVAEVDPDGRCKALVDAIARSTIVRRGAAAFARPKS